MNLLKYKFIRFLIFMVLWFGLGQVIYLVTQPKFTKPNEYFAICAEKLVKDDRPLPLYTIKDYQANPSEFRLCKTPVKYRKWYFRLELYQNADQSYLLKTWSDSMADPTEYHYNIVNDNIEPIAWRHSTMLTKVMAYFYGLIIGTIIYKLVKRIYFRKKSWQ